MYYQDNSNPNSARASPDPDRPRRVGGFRRPPVRTRTVTLILEAGLRVRLNTPNNPYLHGHPGVVKELTPYGAVVATSAAASGQYRAFPHELDPIDFDPPVPPMEAEVTGPTATMMTASPAMPAPAPSAVREQAHRHRAAAAAARRAKETDVMSPTGNICARCGSCRMVRSGACEVCLDCGESGGCG